MCGIIGYVGQEPVTPILLDGLSKLEYRGYDSAGVAVLSGGQINVVKAKGRLSVLAGILEGGSGLPGHIGIGHTRWATHGKPSDLNAHPHVSTSGKIAVVHNGIIENYQKIKEFLAKKGVCFTTETDTEVVAQLVEYFYDGDIFKAVAETLRLAQGSYALGILCMDFPDQIIAVRKEAPLIVGLSEDGNYIASDIPAILNRTRRIYRLADREIVVLKADGVEVYDIDGERVQKEEFYVDWDVSAAEKCGYEHFMFKEIMEQPRAFADTVNPRIVNGEIVLDNIHMSDEYIKNIQRIFIVACGSAYHVGMVGKYTLEKLTRKPVEAVLASEFRYSDPIVDDKTLVIIISQSGETADTLAALREAKRRGARTLSIVNVVGSSIANDSDDVLYTWAGPEIAVATTKAYTTQLAAIYLISLYMAKSLGTIGRDAYDAVIAELGHIPEKIQAILEDKAHIQYLASQHFNSKSIFFIGRNLDYAICMEGSLKLKEISYIQSEAYAAGELKHGTISLIEEGTLVMALATGDKLFDKMVSNIKEVKARGAVVIAVTKQGGRNIDKDVDSTISIPHTQEMLLPSLAVIPLQLFAYYTALQKGCDIDKPRNLAKSVTVE